MMEEIAERATQWRLEIAYIKTLDLDKYTDKELIREIQKHLNLKYGTISKKRLKKCRWENTIKMPKITSVKMAQSCLKKQQARELFKHCQVPPVHQSVEESTAPTFRDKE